MKKMNGFSSMLGRAETIFFKQTECAWADMQIDSKNPFSALFVCSHPGTRTIPSHKQNK